MTPEETRRKLSEYLFTNHPGDDVRVEIGPVPWGNWIWDEENRKHVQIKSSELIKFLGFSFAIRAWLKSLPGVKLEPEFSSGL